MTNSLNTNTSQYLDRTIQRDESLDRFLAGSEQIQGFTLKADKSTVSQRSEKSLETEVKEQVQSTHLSVFTVPIKPKEEKTATQKTKNNADFLNQLSRPEELKPESAVSKVPPKPISRQEFNALKQAVSTVYKQTDTENKLLFEIKNRGREGFFTGGIKNMLSTDYLSSLNQNIQKLHAKASALDTMLLSLEEQIMSLDEQQTISISADDFQRMGTLLKELKESFTAVAVEHDKFVLDEDSVLPPKDRCQTKQCPKNKEENQELKKLSEGLRTVEKSTEALAKQFAATVESSKSEEQKSLDQQQSLQKEKIIAWDNAITQLKTEVAIKDQTDNDLVWLHQLDLALQEVTGKNPVTNQEAINAMPAALKLLMEGIQHGVCFPTPKKITELLSARYPVDTQGHAKPKGGDRLAGTVGDKRATEFNAHIKALREEVNAIHKKMDSLDVSSSDYKKCSEEVNALLTQAQQVVDQEQTALKAEQESALYYLKTYRAVAEDVLNNLPDATKETKRDYNTTIRDILQQSTSLQTYYEEAANTPKVSLADSLKHEKVQQWLEQNREDEALGLLFFQCQDAERNVQNVTTGDGFSILDFKQEALKTSTILAGLNHAGIDPTQSEEAQKKREAADKAIQYLDFLKGRNEALTSYKESLDDLRVQLENNPDAPQELTEALTTLSTQVESELSALNKVLNVDGRAECTNQFAGLEAERSLLKKQVSALKNEATKVESALNNRVTRANHLAYQLQSKALENNIQRTRALAQLLQSPEPASKEALAIRYQAHIGQGKAYADIDALIDDAKFVSDPDYKGRINPDENLANYRKWLIEKDKAHADLEVLRAQFNKDIGTLQKEVDRAKNAGGYPNQLSDKLADVFDVFGWFTDFRKEPSSLLIEHNLAMHGTDMAGAYKELAGILATFVTTQDADGEDADLARTSALEKLGLTATQLRAWQANNPEESAQLMANLNHAYKALTTQGDTLGEQALNMLKVGWDVGTKKNIALDMMLGGRTNIVNANVGPPPAAFYALLSLGNATPYLANLASAAQGKNLAATAGAALSTALGCGAVVGGLIVGLTSFVQTKAEKGVGELLVANRDWEVLGNATMAGVQAVFEGKAPTEAVKEFAKYEAMRAGMLEVGKVYTDTREVGASGTIKRYQQEVSAWWKAAGEVPNGQLRLVAAAAVPTLAAGVITFALLFSGIGIIAAAVLAGVAMAGGLYSTRTVWDSFAKFLGLEAVRNQVRTEMHETRVADMEKKADTLLQDALNKQNIVYQNTALKEDKINQAALHQAARQAFLQRINDQLQKEVNIHYGGRPFSELTDDEFNNACAYAVANLKGMAEDKELSLQMAKEDKANQDLQKTIQASIAATIRKQVEKGELTLKEGQDIDKLAEEQASQFINDAVGLYTTQEVAPLTQNVSTQQQTEQTHAVAEPVDRPLQTNLVNKEALLLKLFRPALPAQDSVAKGLVDTLSEKGLASLKSVKELSTIENRGQAGGQGIVTGLFNLGKKALNTIVSTNYLGKLNTHITAYQNAVADLNRELTKLRSEQIAHAGKMNVTEDNLAKINKLMAKVEEQLQHITDEHKAIVESEAFASHNEAEKQDLEHLGAQLPSLAQSHQELIDARNAIEEARSIDSTEVTTPQTAEQKQRAAEWDNAITELRGELQGDYDDAEIIWLHQLDVALREVSEGKAVSGQAAIEKIPEALKLMVGSIPDGVDFPSAKRITELLSVRYPVTAEGTAAIKGNDSLSGLIGESRATKYKEEVKNLRGQIEATYDAMKDVPVEDSQNYKALSATVDRLVKQTQDLVRREQEQIKTEHASALHYFEVYQQVVQGTLNTLPTEVKNTKESYRNVIGHIQQKSVDLQACYEEMLNSSEGVSIQQEKALSGETCLSVLANGTIHIDTTSRYQGINYIAPTFQHSLREGYNVTTLATEIKRTENDSVVLEDGEAVSEVNQDKKGKLESYAALNKNPVISALAEQCLRDDIALQNFTSSKDEHGAFVHGFSAVNFYRGKEIGTSKDGETLYAPGDALNSVEILRGLEHAAIDPTESDTASDKLEAAEKAVEYLDFLEGREAKLADYATSLDKLITQLRSEKDVPSDLIEALTTTKRHVEKELAAITGVLDVAGSIECTNQLIGLQNERILLSECTNQLIGLQNERILLRRQASELKKEIATLNNAFKDRLAQTNHTAYQLQSKILECNIERTRTLAMAAKNQPEQSTLSADLAVLRAEFNTGILGLQQEIARAKQDGGYPNSFTEKLADTFDVFGWFTDSRKEPSSLLIEHNLAMHGTDMVGAYKELAQVLVSAVGQDGSGDGRSVLEKLGLTPKQIKEWMANNPEESAQLTSNLNHAYNALTSKGDGLGQQVANMFKVGWDVGTKKNMALDLMLGGRTNIVNANYAPPPAAFYALLNLGNATPYLANMISAAQGKNLAATAGAALGVALGGGVVVGAAIVGLASAAQTKLEKTGAELLVANRDWEVFGNATRKGVEALMNGKPPADFVKEFAKYEAMRAGMLELGKVHTDFREGGALGAIKRYQQEIGAWWKAAGTVPNGQLKLAATATITTVAAGAVTFALLFSGIGVLAAAILAIAAMAGGAFSTRALWETFAKLLGLSGVQNQVKAEMHKNRLATMNENAKASLKNACEKQKFAYKKEAALKDATLKLADFYPAAAESLQKHMETQLVEKAQALYSKKPEELSDEEFNSLFNRIFAEQQGKASAKNAAFEMATAENAAALQVHIEASLQNDLKEGKFTLPEGKDIKDLAQEQTMTFLRQATDLFETGTEAAAAAA